MRTNFVRRLVLSAVVVLGLAGAASPLLAQTSPTLSIPSGLDPVGIANSTMTSAVPYVTAAIGIGLVLVFAVGLYRLISRKASRIGK